MVGSTESARQLFREVFDALGRITKINIWRPFDYDWHTLPRSGGALLPLCVVPRLAYNYTDGRGLGP